MAEGVAFSIVGKLAEYTVDPVLRQIKYLFFYNSNIQNLKKKVKKLEKKRNDVKLKVDAAERNADIILQEVSEWLKNVDELKKTADEVLNGVESSEMRCLFNRCPNLKSRYLLSRRATKKTIEADELKLEGTFERVGNPRPPVQVLNKTSHEGFETRLSTKKKIKEALKDKDISIIGICGMPGVGKTTMANEIAKEAKDEKLFEDVAFVVVSKDPDINKIQEELAEILGLKIEQKTTSMRAGRLCDRLNNGKSILVVLDDVWNEFDLGTIGIPSPHDRKGLKIMLTTRIEETCSKMEARKFEIKILDEEEGWKLFKDTARISDDEPDEELVHLAKEVANKCGRLPLALVVVGKALTNIKATHRWRDALLRLQSGTNWEMENTVFRSTRLSYEYLEIKEEQELLLLCSLFAEDESIPIEILVRYARGLELFEETETLSKTRDRANSFADNLKSCNLLQPGKMENQVKLHDVIRDFCLQMKPEYLVKHAGLTEWPERNAHESYSAISITFDKLDQLPSGLKYRNVKLLRVICRELGECKISEEFFKDMKDLGVLELKGMYIQSPSSIELLTGLRTLSLIHCKINSQLSMIGSLKKLEILSFHDSFSADDFTIEFEFEFANLGNLRSLDLRFRKSSCPLRPGVLSGMKKLEELCLGPYIPIEGEDAKILKNVVSELDENGFINLKTLILFEGDFEYLIDATNSIPNGTFGKLESLTLEKLPKLIEICNGNLPRGVIKPQLFCNLKTVRMASCDAIRSLFRESVANSLVNLQSLHISFCEMLEEVVSADARENGVTEPRKMLVFPKLKDVELWNLSSFKSFTSQSNSGGVQPTLFNQVNFPNMEKLSVTGSDCIEKLLGKEMPITSLPKLTHMEVESCSELLAVAESDSIQLLQNLEILGVSDCYALGVLFDFEGIKVTNDDAEINMLGRLETLQLFGLPKLVHITRMVPKGICVFQNLTSLNVEDCESLIYLFSPSIVNSLVALEGLLIQNCHALEEIFGREEEEENTSEKRNIVMDADTPSNLHHFAQVISMVAKRNEVIDMLEFPKLKKLDLSYLSNFKSFRSESNNDAILRTLFNRVNFPNMESLDVYELGCIEKLLGKEMPITSLPKLTHMGLGSCDKLLAVAESDSIQLLQNLDRLEVCECRALEVLFDFEGIKVTNDDAEINMLGRLETLWLLGLPKLVHITRMVPKGICVFQNLKDLTVKFCKSLIYLFSPSMARSLVALNTLEVSNCESIEEIIGKEEEEGTSEIKTVGGTKTIIAFPNMKRLQLKALSSIQMFCSQNYELAFPSLEDLTIERCPEMKKLSSRPPSAPKLSKHTRERYNFFDISDLLDESGGSPKEEQVSKNCSKCLISWV